MTEVLVTFSDGYTVCHPICETTIVAQARVTAWLTRYPASSTREFSMKREISLIDPTTGAPSGSSMERSISVIVIDTKEKASQEVRDLCAYL